MVSEVLYNCGAENTNGDTKYPTQITLAAFYLYYIMTARFSCFKSVLIRAIQQ